jgi:hypothetical protein
LPQTPIEIVRAVWSKTEPECSIISVADAVERVIYDCLEQAHCGWEDNEGAYGEFTFDVVNRKITLDYNERYPARTIRGTNSEGDGYGSLLSSRALLGQEMGWRR